MKNKKDRNKVPFCTVFQTKRRPVDRLGLRRIYARLARRQRVSAAEADESFAMRPNVGVARALVIILGLHVLAIVGIYIHNRYIDRDQQQAAQTEVQPVGPATPPGPAPAAEPKLTAGEFAYVVVAGDNYARVAAEHGIAEEELRVANLNVPLRPGRLLRIPPRRVVAVEPQELTRRRNPAATPADDPPAPATAVLVRPARRLEQSPPPKATAVREPAYPKARVVREPAATAGRAYQVKAGDSVWRIANRFKVGQQQLMSSNGLSDPRQLRAGMTLRIPTQN